MSGRVARQGWVSQPQYPVQIDWDNPDARDLRFMYVGSMPIDLVTGQSASISGGASQRTITSAQGAAVGPDLSGSSYLDFGTRPSWNITGPMAFMWRGVFDATTGAFRCLFSKDSSPGSQVAPFDVYLDSSGSSLACIRAASGQYQRWELARTPVVGALTTIAYNAPGANIQDQPFFALNGEALAGASLTGGIGTGPAGANTDGLRVGRRLDGATQLDGTVEITAIWARSLSGEEHARVFRNPYSLLKPVRRRLYFIGATTGVFGTSAATLAATTGTASAGVLVSGTSARTLSSVTGVASTAVRVSGTAALTLNQLAGISAAGALVSGTSARTLGTIAGTAATAVAVVATSSVTLGGLTASASGIVGAAPAIGNSTATLSAFTGSSTAAARVTATASINLAAVSGSASGTLGIAPIQGTSAAVLAQFIGFSVGTVTGTPVINTAGAITLGRSGHSTSSSRPRASAMRRPRMN
jgi:hypothetical protein